MDIQYRIGLDIGIGSVGWAVLQNDPATEEPIKILKVGVRTFNANEVKKTGESTAKNRRELRGERRRKRRKQHRLDRTKKLLSNQFSIDVEKQLYKLCNVDVYKLRSDALDSKITYGELSKVILNLIKHRGFESNKKASTKSSDEGKLKESTGINTRYLQERGYRTFGEAIFKDDKYKIKVGNKQVYNARNHGRDYKNCFDRKDIYNELLLILDSQRELGNNLVTEEFKNRVLQIFSERRSFDVGPGAPSPYSANFEIGNCTFYKQLERAPKNSYTCELFTALGKLNSLKLDSNVGREELTAKQRQVLLDYILLKGSMSFEKVRKLLNLPNNYTFNLCRYSRKKGEELTEQEIISKSEKSKFVNLDASFKIANILGFATPSQNTQLVDEIAVMLSKCKSEEKVSCYINNYENLSGITNDQIISLMELNIDKFGSLSLKAMSEINPYLLNGQRYDVACKSAGFNHSSLEKKNLNIYKVRL